MMDTGNDFEKRIGKVENRVTELEARADFKDVRIKEINSQMMMMNTKLDNISQNIQKIQLDSVTDDQDIDNRVTSLESVVKVLKWGIGIIITIGLALIPILLKFGGIM